MRTNIRIIIPVTDHRIFIFFALSFVNGRGLMSDWGSMVTNGDNAEKTVVKKEGGRVIDKDLDIF